MQSLLHFSSLQEVIPWKLFIRQAFHIPKGFIEDSLSIRAVIQLVKDPTTVKLDDSIAVDYLAVVIRMPILVILLFFIMQEGEIIPDPVSVIYGPLVMERRVHLDTFRCAYSHILLDYEDAVDLYVFGNAAIVSH